MAKDEDYEVDDETIDDEDPYSGKGRKEMLDDDEISSEEEGFLEGYDEADSDVEEEKDEHEDEEHEPAE